ncbi:hypothetical protein BGV40_04520 [Methanosarcina sp. Ant1]|nr:hypothetical protein BGV40_04520 [Methanosarcina sp. Ant1]
MEEYTGFSVEIFPEDDLFTCLINSIGVPSSVIVGNAGKDVTMRENSASLFLVRECRKLYNYIEKNIEIRIEYLDTIEDVLNYEK